MCRAYFGRQSVALWTWFRLFRLFPFPKWTASIRKRAVLSRRLDQDRERIKFAKARAVEIVTARRDDVRKVAEALMQYRTLDSQQVDWVLHGKAGLIRSQAFPTIRGSRKRRLIFWPNF
jgi:RNase P/RNase MRP subunit POP5